MDNQYLEDLLNSVVYNDKVDLIEKLIDGELVSPLRPRILRVSCKSGRVHILPINIAKVDEQYIKSAMIIDIASCVATRYSCCINVENSNKFYEISLNLEQERWYDSVINMKMIGEFPESAIIHGSMFMKNGTELRLFDIRTGLLPNKFYVPDDFNVKDVVHIINSTNKHISVGLSDGSFVSIGHTESAFAKIPNTEIIYATNDYLLRMNGDQISYVEIVPETGSHVPGINERCISGSHKDIHWVDDIIVFKLNENHSYYYRIRIPFKINSIAYKDIDNNVVYVAVEDDGANAPSVYECNLQHMAMQMFLPIYSE